MKDEKEERLIAEMTELFKREHIIDILSALNSVVAREYSSIGRDLSDEYIRIISTARLACEKAFYKACEKAERERGKC